MNYFTSLLQDPVTFVIVICALALLIGFLGWLTGEVVWVFKHRRARSDRKVPRRGSPVPARDRQLLGDCWYDRVDDFRKDA